MEEPKTEKQIQFRLKSIHVTKCFFRKPEQKIHKNQNFGFSFTFGTHFDKASSEILIEVGANIYLSPKQQIAIGEITTKTHFGVNNINEFVEADNQFVFPEDFIVMLMSISFSTLRGIVVEKTASTIQQSIVLPVININEIIRNQKNKK